MLGVLSCLVQCTLVLRCCGVSSYDICPACCPWRSDYSQTEIATATLGLQALLICTAFLVPKIAGDTDFVTWRKFGHFHICQERRNHGVKACFFTARPASKRLREQKGNNSVSVAIRPNHTVLMTVWCPFRD
ncbi:hypothetical protein M378DRAFT_623479 [Amanita muscaria Koide BX008]|uniref:Secreted protein n=1 Tax=Amanita muscaria (strain Koide BX008) TaxID=946122 RepID=A0A0C2T3K0_AMAMK|nr:hypothetical protein M378DRAFT_623479 [Amanita muscaria Koide BX008]